MDAPMDTLSEVIAELSKRAAEGIESVPDAVRAVHRLTELFREREYRENAEEGVFIVILKFLTSASCKVQSFNVEPSISLESWFQLLAECFRCLRNSCVQCTRNQSTLRNIGVIEESVYVIKTLSSTNNVKDSCLAAFRCGLQFLGNIAAGNRDSQNSIWKCAFPELFLNCLTHEDEKVVSYCAMVLFTCINRENVEDLQETSKLKVALNVISAYKKQPDAEWLYLIVTNHFLKCPDLVKAMYAQLINQERIAMLELLIATISEKDPLSEEESNTLQRIAEFISVCFQDQCKAVLKLASPGDNDEEESMVVIRLLDVLCEMTSNNDHLACLQSCPGLLETVVDILHMTHLAGKQSKNIFTATHTMTMGLDATHAVVGFKAHLIRLIGNLCYENKENQDKIYQLEGIPLILDNCSIDDNNPFLNQWAVFAIRNITEHNERNQELIAKLEHYGLADSSVLENMGLHVEERDGKLVLKSLKKSST
ncbi:ataxin-10 [Bombina bombina]|uniref:ataxin-10 n=1 Tax=Bombina bombina TaxID=8345 RepID=UPI00235AF9FA|nr:ataxin-10 [Bombina bombina]